MPWKPLSLSVPWETLKEDLPKFVDPDNSVKFPTVRPANYQAQLFFNIGLREVITPGTLDALQFGWRFLAPKPPQSGPAVAVYLSGAGAVTSVSYGDGINRAQQASVYLEEHPPTQIETAQEVKTSDYEIR